jgi:hypothetical protein
MNKSRKRTDIRLAIGDRTGWQQSFGSFEASSGLQRRVAMTARSRDLPFTGCAGRETNLPLPPSSTPWPQAKWRDLGSCYTDLPTY